MKTRFILATLLTWALFSQQLLAQAGDDRVKELKEATKKDGEGWTKGAGIGLDFAQLALINPRVGAGTNRIGFGGLGTLFFNYKKGKLSWENSGSLQLGVQRIKRNPDNNPFEKNLDLLRFDSKAGWVPGSNDKWSIATLLTVITQITPTYEGNILKPSKGEKIQSRFFNPGLISFSPGIDYKPNPKLSLFYSPISVRAIIVGDQEIANLGVHGTQLDRVENGVSIFKKTDIQAGSNFRATYNDKYAKDKVVFKSALDLYSNYLREPQNIDVIWQNDLGIQIFKSISLNLSVLATYDHDLLVQTDTNKNGIYGEVIPAQNLSERGKRMSFTQALYIKYNYVF